MRKATGNRLAPGCCVYDNPATWQREFWQDGKIICIYAFKILPPFVRKEASPLAGRYFGSRFGPVISGQIVGDATAMTKENRP